VKQAANKYSQDQLGQHCSLELIQNYFFIKKYFSLITFQYKYRHKPNFSISEQGAFTGAQTAERHGNGPHKYMRACSKASTASYIRSRVLLKGRRETTDRATRATFAGARAYVFRELPRRGGRGLGPRSRGWAPRCRRRRA
jgi:hypothetical protein